jgi:hypothetical protein
LSGTNLKQTDGNLADHKKAEFLLTDMGMIFDLGCRVQTEQNRTDLPGWISERHPFPRTNSTLTNFSFHLLISMMCVSWNHWWCIPGMNKRSPATVQSSKSKNTTSYSKYEILYSTVVVDIIRPRKYVGPDNGNHCA